MKTRSTSKEKMWKGYKNEDHQNGRSFFRAVVLKKGEYSKQVDFKKGEKQFDELLILLFNNNFFVWEFVKS